MLVPGRFNLNSDGLVPGPSSQPGNTFLCDDRTFKVAGGSTTLWYPASYVASRYYIPCGMMSGNAFAAAGVTTQTRFTPIFVPQAITISELGAKLSTVSAGGNFQLAIYANASNLPTGAPLATTASLSTTTAGVISGALGSNVSLTPGFYWIGQQVDNTTALFVNTLAGMSSQLNGATTSSNLATNQNANLYWVFTTTFGTWPTTPAVTESTNASNLVWLTFFKVLSVP